MQLKFIKHGTEEYKRMIDLRMDLLRRPLGLSFTREQLDAEKNDMLIGAFEEKEIIGCCILTAHDKNTVQLRQMAVSGERQTKGIGRSILEFAEKISKEKGYSVLMMHARDIATGFYQKCGYGIIGDEFTEVGIPHRYMEKQLR